MCVCGAPGGQKRALHQELELEMAGSQHVGTEPRSCAPAASDPGAEPSLQSQQ